MAVEKIRFYLDENLDIEIAVQLEGYGVDVVTVRDLGYLGDDDLGHLKRAAASGRVLCTHDSDFIQLASQGIEHAGIVFGQQDSHNIGSWVKHLLSIHAVCKSDDMKNNVRYL